MPCDALLSISVILTCSSLISLLVGGNEFSTEEEDENYAPAGRCDMHLASLAFGYALSLVVRTQNGNVINRWAPFMDLFSGLKKCVKHLFDQKNKARRKEYEDSLAKAGKATRNIPLPNTTRVGGAQIMMKASLCSMHSLRFHAADNTAFEAKMLTLEQWAQIAQFVAVMSAYFAVCLTSQDTVWKLLAKCLSCLQCWKPNTGMGRLLGSLIRIRNGQMISLSMICLQRRWPPQRLQLLSTKFRKYLIFCHFFSTFAEAFYLLAHLYVRFFCRMLSADSIELRRRCLDSFREYFNDMADDRILAMSLNPVLLDLGLSDLEMLWDDQPGKFVRFVEKAKKLLKAAVEQMIKPEQDLVTVDESNGKIYTLCIYYSITQ